jgi:phasin
MASQAFQPFEISPEMRAFAERSVEQAKQAFDGFMSATQEAVSSLEQQAASTQAGARDVAQKAASFAERNVDASFEFAQRLVRAKDAEEVVRLHADYVKTQMEAFAEQARELGQAASKAQAKSGPSKA